jgi:hypothetical protein
MWESTFAAAWIHVRPWKTMVVIAGAVFLILKFVALVHFERREGRTISIAERLSWLCTWPGMNARHFFSRDHTLKKPTGSAWIWAVGETALGGLLFGVLAPRLLVHDELVAGWVALVGLAFLLHFGSLHILALIWRRAGRPVEPIMRAPIFATSLEEFWSRRWNLAFRDFARTFVFRPLARRFGSVTAMWGGFAFSGLVHDLAISVPARGGFGLPTAYVLLQGAGVLAERSEWGRKLGLGNGWRGWMFALLITAPPAFFLFHTCFISQVIVPLIVHVDTLKSAAGR